MSEQDKVDFGEWGKLLDLNPRWPKTGDRLLRAEDPWQRGVTF